MFDSALSHIAQKRETERKTNIWTCGLQAPAVARVGQPRTKGICRENGWQLGNSGFKLNAKTTHSTFKIPPSIMKISKTLVPWLPRNPTWGLYNKQHNIIHTKEHMDFYILHFFITSLEVIHILIPINLDTLPSFLLLMKVFLHVKSNQMSLATNQTTIWFISSFRVPWPLKAVKLQNLKIFFLVIETHKHTLHFFCLKIGFLVRHFFFILSCVWFYHQLDTPPSLPCHTHTHTSYWFH